MNSIEYAKQKNLKHKSIKIKIVNIIMNFPDERVNYIESEYSISRNRHTTIFEINDVGIMRLESHNLCKTIVCEKCGKEELRYYRAGASIKFCSECSSSKYKTNYSLSSKVYAIRKTRSEDFDLHSQTLHKSNKKGVKLLDWKLVDYWNENSFLGINISPKTKINRILKDYGFQTINNMIDWINEESLNIGLGVSYNYYE